MLHVLIPCPLPLPPPILSSSSLYSSFFSPSSSFPPSLPLSLPPAISAALLLPTSTATHQVSLDITSCTADIVTPVGVANQSITTVALDPATNITYWAGSRESGVYRMYLEGNPLLPSLLSSLLPIHCLVLILPFHPFLLPHSVTLSLCICCISTPAYSKHPVALPHITAY